MMTQLSPSEMKQRVANHFEDFVNKRNAKVIRINMTDDFYDHDGPGGKPAGRAIDEQMMLKMYDAMPDLRLTIEQMIAEDDTVVCRNIWRWTDPASSKKMQFHGSCSGALKGIESPNAGLLSQSLPTEEIGPIMHSEAGSSKMVALCGATGRAGSRILNELVARGHPVLAIAREEGKVLPRDGSHGSR